MSKESQLPLERTVMIEKNGRDVPLTFDERFRRYPVSDRDVREVLGLSDDGHHQPPPSSRRKK